jgi:hypothetical protein
VEFVGGVIGRLGEKEATEEAIYFAAWIVFRWSLCEEGATLLRDRLGGIDVGGIIDKFRPVRPGVAVPGAQISVLLFAALLNVWKRFVDGERYVEWIFAIVPNVVLPICWSERFPYDEMSFLAAMESVALAFVQAVSEVPRIATTFRNPELATRIMIMRDEREEDVAKHRLAVERLRTEGMRALEEMVQLRENGDAVARRNEDLAGEIGEQRKEHVRWIERTREAIAVQGKRIEELETDVGRSEGRIADLEDRIENQVSVEARRRGEIPALRRGMEEKKERIAELEERLERARKRVDSSADRWGRAAARVLARPDADVALAAILTTSGSAS